MTLSFRIKHIVAQWLKALGYKIIKLEPPSDIPATHIEVANAVSDYTMTSLERLSAAQFAIEYLVKNRIHGSIVECGVWRGGTILAIINTLIRLGDLSRDIYLFDTFEGMTQPTPLDRDLLGRSAGELLNNAKREPGNNVWAIATLEEVKENVLGAGYPSEKIHFVKGDVLTTLPENSPRDEIALLRLDTDWYASTKHELKLLYPKLADGGILIIDDYGHYEGARQAVDEYFQEVGFCPFLNRIDYTSRLIIRNFGAEVDRSIK